MNNKLLYYPYIDIPKSNWAVKSILYWDSVGIDELIPYPIEPNLTMLRKFKDKHHEELTSFRILLEQIAFDIALLNSKDNQDYKKSLKLAEVNDKREKILSELDQSNFGQITFGTICGLTGAVIAFQQENHPLGFFSLANAIHSAFQGYDKSATLTKDYSYLALIDRKFKPQNSYDKNGSH